VPIHEHHEEQKDARGMMKSHAEGGELRCREMQPQFLSDTLCICRWLSLSNLNSLQVLLRIRADDASALCCLGTKYGCEPADAAAILAAAAALHTDVVGVSFHVGSGSRDPKVSPLFYICKGRQIFMLTSWGV